MDPKKKFILFTPIGERYIGRETTDTRVLEALGEFDGNVLVRLPPTDVAHFEGFKKNRAVVSFEETGMRAWKGEIKYGSSKVNEISKEDDEILRASLHYADVVVSGPSTICIDASLLDKPVILIDFDGDKNLQYYKSVRRYYNYNHFLPIRKSGGARFAESPAALISHVESYLAHPEQDAEGRARIREWETYQNDGKSTERLTVVLEKLLYAS